jgi:hypothetical protein
MINRSSVAHWLKRGFPNSLTAPLEFGINIGAGALFLSLVA